VDHSGLARGATSRRAFPQLRGEPNRQSRSGDVSKSIDFGMTAAVICCDLVILELWPRQSSRKRSTDFRNVFQGCVHIPRFPGRWQLRPPSLPAQAFPGTLDGLNIPRQPGTRFPQLFSSLSRGRRRYSRAGLHPLEGDRHQWAQLRRRSWLRPIKGDGSVGACRRGVVAP